MQMTRVNDDIREGLSVWIMFVSAFLIFASLNTDQGIWDGC